MNESSRLGRLGFYALSLMIWTLCTLLSETPAEWSSDTRWMSAALFLKWLGLTIAAAVGVRVLLAQKGVASLRGQLVLAYLGLAISRTAVWFSYKSFLPEMTAIANARPVPFVLLGVPSGRGLLIVAGVLQTVGVLLVVSLVDWVYRHRRAPATSGT